MLVLTRKLNESIFLGDDVKVTIVKIDGTQVRIGIDAPRSCIVLREELAPKDHPLNTKTTK